MIIFKTLNQRIEIYMLSTFVLINNDPSAGSPTETLLRLLLPLNNQVRSTSVKQLQHNEASQRSRPETSLNNSIGSSDGRCVQRAGT
jgi:hypothetical protein